MKIGEILRQKQPDVYKKIKRKQKKKEREQYKKQQHLSFRDIQELMKHDSYKRHRGALRQRSWGL